MHPQQPTPPPPPGDGVPQFTPPPPAPHPPGPPAATHPQVVAAQTPPDRLYQVPSPAPGHPPVLPLADPFMRLLARIIDGFVAFFCNIVAGLAATAVLLLLNGGDMDNAPLWQAPILVGALVGSGFCYEWLMVRAAGQTVGKRLLGLRIVDAADGGRLPSGRAALRALCYSPSIYYPISWFPVLAQLNVLWMLWDRPGRQCLHDKLVKTVVIDEKQLHALYPPQPPAFPPHPSHPYGGPHPQYPQPPHGG